MAHSDFVMGSKRHSLPLAVLEALDAFGSKCALNERRSPNDWHPINGHLFIEYVKSFAHGLIANGLKPGDAVGIVAPSSPYWLIADLGIQLAGGISVPIFDNICSEHLEFEIRDADLQFMYCDGEEAWNKLAPHLAEFRHVIVRSTKIEPSSHCIEYERFMNLAGHDAPSTAIEALVEQTDDNPIATIIYTSGSTGTPKGVELTHSNLLSQTQGAGEIFPLDSYTDRAMSGLPLAHVFERMVVYFYLISGVDLYFVDDISNIGHCIREIRPTTMTMVPRLLEKLYGKLYEKANEAPFPRKQIARWAIKRATRLPIDRKSGPSDFLAQKLVYRKFQDALGGKFKRVLAGGAPLASNLQRFFINIGIPIYVGYGLTEAAPVLSANRPNQNRVGTVGPTYPDVTLKISEKSEILAKGPNIMRGYHNNPEATARAIDVDGWLHTGDLGHIDSDGFLTIDGRVKELLKTSNGKYVTPVPIELSLCQSSLIDIAMVIAEGKPFVSCILFLDLKRFETLKKRQGGSEIDNSDFLSSQAIRSRIDRHIERTNNALDDWERIRAYRCVLDTPSIAAGEITPTMKLKRNAIEAKYQHLIDAMYAGHDHIQSNHER